MTTFEEDVVEIYYNLNDFFTIKNIPFSAVETRKGGAGRGEIDILAIHVKDKNFKNCSHIEASFSMTDGFPHVNSGKTIIRKFFSNDSEAKIKEIVGNTPYSCIMITSDFKRDTKERLKNKIIKGGGKVLNLVGRDRG
ncbi:MAG TPA: hypothetical protein VJC16_07065, partial [Candidatus Nanoarchaeia archaeon]|nr:hypothetical protein [Candidatus Nanoarchaeia archaeon]